PTRSLEGSRRYRSGYQRSRYAKSRQRVVNPFLAVEPVLSQQRRDFLVHDGVVPGAGVRYGPWRAKVAVPDEIPFPQVLRVGENALVERGDVSSDAPDGFGVYTAI